LKEKKIFLKKFVMHQRKEVFKIIGDNEVSHYRGRTEFDFVDVDNEVVIHYSKKLPIGDFVNVRITKANDYDLDGEVA